MVVCSEYDHIELVCLYQFPIRLTMKEGAPITGIALDTSRNESSKECIKISSNKIEILVELDGICQLEVLVKNPHFAKVVFE